MTTDIASVLNQSHKSTVPPLQIAVLVPCYNEEHSIREVVEDFRRELPTASIYVFDNNSKDRTVEIAKAAGAVVKSVTFQGKGNVVRQAFADVEADVYFMVDGDSTYDAKSAQAMLHELLSKNLDMVVGCRADQGEEENYRRGHRFGNWLLTGAVKHLFGRGFTDMLSGYRLFSKRFVKSFPALTPGFEIETELTIHALELRMPCGEIMTPYGARPEGSTSKLSTYKDGFKILASITRLYMVERPLRFFSYAGLLMIATALILIYPVVTEYYATGLVRRFPTAILSVGLILSGQLAFVCGFVLNTVTHARHEIRRLAYLKVSGPSL